VFGKSLLAPFKLFNVARQMLSLFEWLIFIKTNRRRRREPLTRSGSVAKKLELK